MSTYTQFGSSLFLLLPVLIHWKPDSTECFCFDYEHRVWWNWYNRFLFPELVLLIRNRGLAVMIRNYEAVGTKDRYLPVKHWNKSNFPRDIHSMLKSKKHYSNCPRLKLLKLCFRSHIFSLSYFIFVSFHSRYTILCSWIRNCISGNYCRSQAYYK